MIDIGKLRSDAQRWGWPNALMVRGLSGLERILRMNLLVVRTAKADANQPHANPPDRISVRIADPEELEPATRQPELDLTAAFLAEAKLRGDVVCGAFDAEELLGYSWCSVTRAPDLDGFWVMVPRSYWYSYKSFVRPGYRGKRLQQRMLACLDQHMLASGYSQRVGFVDASNIASLRGGNRAGYEKIGYILCWRNERLSCHFRTSGVRKIGFGFARAPEVGRSGVRE